MLKLLDCTLRDGGYYNNWNYSERTLTEYFKYLNKLPVDFVEVGYRSIRNDQYLGELFYTPLYILEKAESLMPEKRKAIMLDEKDVTVKDLDILLNPCKDLIHLVRIAVAPERLKKGIDLAKAIKDKGYMVAINLMYASQWLRDDILMNTIKKEVRYTDYLYLVDSYGSLYPDNVKKLVTSFKNDIDVPLGFHGHNNLELALINSLTAIENGCEIIDATVLGMGRGAGNLKTELLLIALKEKYNYDLDFDSLSSLTSLFETLQEEYKWGTNLAYMLSGAYSIPQKEVMEQMNKRRYFVGNIIESWKKYVSADSVAKKTSYPYLSESHTEIIITGGGSSVTEQAEAFKMFVNIKQENNTEIDIIHSTTRFAELFNHLFNFGQYFCLVGKEGKRLESFCNNGEIINNHCFIVPSEEKGNGLFIPPQVKNIFQCSSRGLTAAMDDSPLAIAIQAALDKKATKIYLYGFDGYLVQHDHSQLDLFNENQQIINSVLEKGIELISLTPTRYSNIRQVSIFQIITSTI